jgi:hypothetical protein
MSPQLLRDPEMDVALTPEVQPLVRKYLMSFPFFGAWLHLHVTVYLA